MLNEITPDLKYTENTHTFPFDDYDGPFYLISGTDFKFYPAGEIYQDLTCAEEFGRLHRIKQLGTAGYSSIAACQDQTRAFHSEVTGIMMDIVLYKNGFNEHERKLGIAAGLYHDLATPPFSDQGKLIKPGSYEEEHLVEWLIKRSPEIQKRLKKHEIALDELVAAIQGKGIVGNLLNSSKGIDVDNISYLAIDQLWMPGEAFDDERREIKKIKGVFDQYYNIKFKDGEWIFDNPYLLIELLEFRALMYRMVYPHPFNRAKEAFLMRALKNHKPELEEVIAWGDNDFRNWFGKTFGYHESHLYFDTLKHAFRVKKAIYDFDPNKIDGIVAELRKQHEDENITVAYLKPPRDAIRNRVIFHGEVRWLEEIPEFSFQLETKIRAIIKKLDYIGVFERATEKEDFDFSLSGQDLRKILRGEVVTS